MQLGAVEIFDGKKGYNFFVSEEVFSTKKAINIENWDDKKIFLHVNNVDFTNPCRNYKEKGHKADYQGVTDFEGKECHKVKFIANPVYSDTAKLSKEEYYFFEKDTFVYYGMKTIEKNNDVIIEVNEKQNIINQVYVPQKILLKRNGNLTTILIYEKFLLNHKCDDEDFNFLNYQKE